MKRCLTHLVFAVVTVAVVLGALEVASRLAYVVVSGSWYPWWVCSPDLGWDRRANFSGQIFGARREFDADGFFRVDSDQRRRRSNETRIVLLGDSCTFGNGVETARTYGEILDDLLSNSAVLNLATPGFSSLQGLKSLKMHIDALSPDIITVAFNFNDRRCVPEHRLTDGAGRFEHTDCPELLDAVFLARSIKHMLIWVFEKTRTNVSSLDALYPRVSAREYATNLASIVRLARSRGASVIFIGMSDNPLSSQPLYRGIESLSSNDLDAAIEQLAPIAQDIESAYSLLGKRYLAAAYEKKGMRARAAEVQMIRVSCSLHGGSPIFPDWEYSGVMRRVAQRLDVLFIDAGSILSQDPACFIDYCHFDGTGHQTIATLIFEAILRSREIQPTEQVRGALR